MITATATPSCRVTRSSRDTPAGPDPGVSGRPAGLIALAPLSAGWDGWGRGPIRRLPPPHRSAAAARLGPGRPRPWPGAGPRHPRPWPETPGGGCGTRVAAGSAPAADAHTPATPAGASVGAAPPAATAAERAAAR